MDTVISTHDLLTKTLQCDVDGDEMLLTHDRAFIDLLDRDKLPLYYEMRKADNMEINNQNILKCLEKSFENSRIGEISNALTKYLNMDEEPDLDFVRVMTAYNNFCIDNPKSQYMPKLVEKYQSMFDGLEFEKFPYFFKYAKGKNSDLCMQYGKDKEGNSREEKSNINRISKYIMNKTRKDTENIWKDNSEQKRFNPEYFQLKDYEVKRSSETYKKMQSELIRLKALNTTKIREKLKDKYESSMSKKQLGYEPYYFYCNQRICEIVKDDYRITEDIKIRKKAAAYLLDIEYHQEENKNTDKDILWNCFGDILYENLCDNLKIDTKENTIKVKKQAYQNADARAKKIEARVEEAKKELSEVYKTPITKAELEYTDSLHCRKNCERDRYLLYLLLVLYKRKQQYLLTIEDQKSITEDNKRYFRIYKGSKYGKVTRATLDKWLGDITISKNGLERFEKKGLIKIERCKEYDKIYLLFKDKISGDSKEIFTVKNWNPMLDYYLYTGEAKIKKCEICEKLFIAIGNSKTCSEKCSGVLERKNKNRVAS